MHQTHIGHWSSCTCTRYTLAAKLAKCCRYPNSCCPSRVSCAGVYGQMLPLAKANFTLNNKTVFGLTHASFSSQFLHRCSLLWCRAWGVVLWDSSEKHALEGKAKTSFRKSKSKRPRKKPKSAQSMCIFLHFFYRKK